MMEVEVGKGVDKTSEINPDSKKTSKKVMSTLEDGRWMSTLLDTKNPQ